MIRKGSGLTISIFTIAYGFVNLLASIAGNELFLDSEMNIFGIMFSLGLIAIGIISIVFVSQQKNIKGLVVTMIVIWFVIAGMSTIMIVIPYVGPIIFLLGTGLSVAPIITGFQYLASLNMTNQNVIINYVEEDHKESNVDDIE